MAGLIGTVDTEKNGLMPKLTKHLLLRKDSDGGVLLCRLNGTYAGIAMLFTTLNSRGYAVDLYALTANITTNTSRIQVMVKNIISSGEGSNRKVKYVFDGSVLSVYLVRDSNVLTIGGEVIYNDCVSGFMESVDEIPAEAVDATYL